MHATLPSRKCQNGHLRAPNTLRFHIVYAHLPSQHVHHHPFSPICPRVVSPATWSQCSRVPQHSGLHFQGKLPWNIWTIGWNVAQTLGKNLPLLNTCFRGKLLCLTSTAEYCQLVGLPGRLLLHLPRWYQIEIMSDT